MPSAPALKAAPELLATELGPPAASMDPRKRSLPRVPFLRPHVGGGRAVDRSSEKGRMPTPRPVDVGDMPTPSMLRPLGKAAEPTPLDASDDSLDAPIPAGIDLGSQPTPVSLPPNPALAPSDGPLSGPTVPMQAIDVRAALAQEDLPTARMEPNSSLLVTENDMHTRPMPAQKNIAALVARQAAQLGPQAEELETAADVPSPSPSPDRSEDGDEWASEEMDPFFFED